MAVKADPANHEAVPEEIPGEGVYLTDGTTLLRVLAYVERLDEVRAEDCLTEGIVVLVGKDVRATWRVVTPEPKADDGD